MVIAIDVISDQPANFSSSKGTLVQKKHGNGYKKQVAGKNNSVRLSNKTGASETSNTRRFSSRISN